jgi:hypothetical protein
VMTEEFHLAISICERILFPQAFAALPEDHVTTWDELFQPFPFFSTFKNYLQVRFVWLVSTLRLSCSHDDRVLTACGLLHHANQQCGFPLYVIWHLSGSCS